jgi:hypothetical protein
MDGSEGNARIARDNRFRAVAMVGVEIPDGDSRRALGKGVERSHGNVVKETKSHCLVAGGVMARRTHQT